MKKSNVSGEEKKARSRKLKKERKDASTTKKKSSEKAPLAGLQQQVGNRAVQRLIAQRQAGPAETDEETTSQIEQMRGGGQALDSTVQRELGAKMGTDFSGVNVHTSPEADDLNKRLGARAFTTGQDIFFRQGEYAPESDSGKELLAHELTHVVQQRGGVSGNPAAKMVVNPPDDVYEREADTVARQITGPATVQAQAEEEPREEELQAKSIQRQEEEELVMPKSIQRASELEEEEPLQGKRLQRQEMPEEEELQAKTIQRQEMDEEEEMMQAKAIQRQDMPEEEEMQMKAVGREDEEESESAS